MIVRGAGFGHGVGMSQYGAYGFALAGKDHAFILGHYYSGTQLAELGGAPDVRVLLKNAARIRFRGASAVAGGGRRLAPATTYSATRALGGNVVLRSPSGRSLGTYESPLRISGTRGRRARARPRPERPLRRALPRRPRAAPGRARRVGDQRRQPRGLRPRRRRRRGADALARRRAARAGDRRAHVRDRDEQGRRRLRPVRRHALADVHRRRRRGREHERRRRGDARRRSSPTRARRSSRTTSRPRAGAPRTSRTRSSAPSRSRG